MVMTERAGVLVPVVEPVGVGTRTSEVNESVSMSDALGVSWTPPKLLEADELEGVA